MSKRKGTRGTSDLQQTSLSLHLAEAVKEYVNESFYWLALSSVDDHPPPVPIFPIFYPYLFTHPHPTRFVRVPHGAKPTPHIPPIN
jgi:hypothetical protein